MKLQLDNPSAVAINEAFAANPTVDVVEAYGCEIKRSECEREGLWRVCKDKIKANENTIARDKEVSSHRTFAEACAALSAHVAKQSVYGKMLAQWSVYKGEQEEPWISEGFGDYGDRS